MTISELKDAMKEGDRPLGVPEYWDWRWTLNGQNVTRAVKALIRRGEAEAMYFHKSASVSLK